MAVRRRYMDARSPSAGEGMLVDLLIFSRKMYCGWYLSGFNMVEETVDFLTEVMLLGQIEDCLWTLGNSLYLALDFICKDIM